MQIGNLKLSKFQLTNLIVLLVLLVSFIVLPFIVIGFNWNSGAWLFISWLFGLFSLLSNALSYGIFNYVPGDVTFGVMFVYTLVGVYLAAFEIILYFGIKALIKLFKDKDFYTFTSLTKKTYISTLAVCISWIVIRFVLIQIIKSFASNYFGVFGSYAGAATGSFIGFGFGFYLVILAGIVGFFLPYVFKDEAQKYQTKPMNQGIQNMFDNGKQFISQTASNFSKPENENTGDTLPIVTLDGSDQIVTISKLPSKIGRNKETVDNYVFDKSISREHAEIILYEGSVLIQDIGSKFGTYLNNEQLPVNQYYQLLNGDRLRLGNVEFIVNVNEEFLGIKSTPQAEEIWDQDSTISQTGFELNKVTLNDIEDYQGEIEAISQPIDLENNSNKTIILGNNDPNKTIKLDSERSNSFPTVILKSANSEDFYTVDKSPYTIGADYNLVDLKLNDHSISKKHVTIQRVNNQFYVTDLGSTNGTKLNGLSIKPNESHLIKDNDTLIIGRQELIFKEL